MKTIFTLPLLFGFIQLFAQVSVKSYGAKGDGYTDDGAAINKALNSGNSTVYFEAGKTYITSAFLSVPSGVSVVGNGATLKPNSSFTKYAFPVIGTNGKPTYTQSSISISVKKGAKTFSYGKAAYLKVGSLVLLEGDSWIDYYSYGWYGLITGISGTTVTVNVPAPHSFTANKISLMATTKNIHIKGLNVNLKGRTTGYGVGLRHSIYSSISNCYVYSDPTTTSAPVGISAEGVNLTVEKNKVRNIRIATSGEGYGIDVMGNNIVVQFNDVAVARHCITSATGNYESSKIKIFGNTVNCGPGSAPIDFHGYSSGIIDSNIIYSTTPNITGINVRYSNTLISRNVITVNNASGTRVCGISYSENGYNNITIIKNKVYFKGTSGSVCGVSNFSVYGTITNLRIAQNYFQGGISFGKPLGSNIHIDSNKFEGNTVYNPTINFTTDVVKDYYIVGNTFINNFGSQFNYLLSTTTCSTAQGYIKNNKVYCTNTNNLVCQFRINNRYNVLENNVFYTQYKYPLIDYSSDKQNWITNSKMVDDVPTTTLITYSEIPKATAWFLGKIIAYKSSSSSSIVYYKCVQTTSGGYTWQKQSSSLAV